MDKFKPLTDTIKKEREKNKKREQIQKIFTPKDDLPPDWLFRIPNTDIWMTPFEPVEPGDCERWPASCENLLPLNPNDARDISPGFDVETSRSGCSICVTITPSLGIISFPPTTFCYRAPDCSEPEPEQPPPTPNTPPRDPTHPSPRGDVEWEVKDFERLIFFLKAGARVSTFMSQFNDNGYVTERSSTQEILINDPPIDTNDWSFVRRYDNDGSLLIPPFYGYLHSWSYRDGWSFVVRVPALWKLKSASRSTPMSGVLTEQIVYFELPDQTTRSIYWTERFPWEGGTWRTSGINEPNTIYVHRVSDTYTWVPNGDGTNRAVPTQYTGIVTLDASEQPLITDPELPPSHTPTPSPQPMTNCCDLEPLKKLIVKQTKLIEEQKKLLDKFEKVVAPDEFKDCSIPKRFIYLNSTGQHKINNYPELFECLFRQNDAYMGMPSFQVGIKDSDPNTPGDQKVEFQVHSLASGIKGIFQYLIDRDSTPNPRSTENMILSNVGWNQRALMCLAYDLSSLKRIGVVNNAFLQNIEDHLGYGVVKKKIEVPFAVNPNLKQYDPSRNNAWIMKKLFTPTTVNIDITDNTDPVGLPQILNNIGQLAGNAAAGKAFPMGDPNLLDKLVAAAEVKLRLDNQTLLEDMKKQLGLGTEEELKEWIKDAEFAYDLSGGNKENSPENRSTTAPNQQIIPEKEGKYYGNKSPAKIENTTKRSRRRNRRS